MADIIYEKESYQIIGASLEVHKELGPGFLEAVYQEALTIEFSKQSIPFCREKELRLYYKNVSLQKRYKVDFVCYDSIIIEVKALSALNSEHESQLINYLSATRLKLGILINFGERSLKYKRIIK
ncbi:MAG: GxxExxY protein [Calditrichia bacterium]|nr:GxxExxY protein [Calditrichia bacterium]